MLVPGAGAGCRVPVLPGAGAGAGAVSWLCTRCWCWCRVLAVRVVETGYRVPVPGASMGGGCVAGGEDFWFAR